MTPVALLDVNVLVALFDPDHVHHEPAHEWFAANRKAGWATCPITENGLVRILSNPAYTVTHETPRTVIGRLEVFRASGEHVFWQDDLSLRDPKVFHQPSPATYRQLTDVYLLGLARRKGGRLATFDGRIPLGAIVGATEKHLQVIPA